MINPALEISSESSTINRLQDPIEIITDYLSHSEQGTSRLINREFNRRIGNSHAAIKQKLQLLTHHVKQVIADLEENNGVINDTTLYRLQHLDDELKYDSLYMNTWPNIIRNSIENSHKLKDFSYADDTYFHHAVGWRKKYTNVPEMDVPIKLLRQSLGCMLRLLVRHQFSMQNKTINTVGTGHAFNVFIIDATWTYLSDSKRNRSKRLPPLRSLCDIKRNVAIYEQELKYLERLRNEYGFILLNPLWIEQMLPFGPFQGDCFTNFREFGSEFVAFNNWLKDKDNTMNPDFPWFIKVC